MGDVVDACKIDVVKCVFKSNKCSIIMSLVTSFGAPAGFCVVEVVVLDTVTLLLLIAGLLESLDVSGSISGDVFTEIKKCYHYLHNKLIAVF